jgi:hypothetical protein
VPDKESLKTPLQKSGIVRYKEQGHETDKEPTESSWDYMEASEKFPDAFGQV